MNLRTLLAALLAAGVALGLLFWAFPNQAKCAPVPPGVHPGGPTRISGPFTSNNLSVFLIHGENKLKGKTFLTLQEALTQKKLIVRETGDVNRLSVENLSDSVVFIQSGDIVKGGRQDRAMQYDLLIPPKSGQMPLPAFCVEHGRWSGRGGENAAKFDSSSNQLIGKDLKLAAKKAGDQSMVWDYVAQNQQKLCRKLCAPVASSPSPTSLQLTLENKKVQQSSSDHIKKLEKIIEGHNDVIGYAFAINGKMNSADVYASSELFKKLWPKLLQASAVEAIAEQEKGKTFKPADESQVRACLADADKAPAAPRQDVTKRCQIVTQESSRNILFETLDQDTNIWVHKNYVAK